MAEAGARFTAAAVSDDAPRRAQVCEPCLSGAKEEEEEEEADAGRGRGDRWGKLQRAADADLEAEVWNLAAATEGTECALVWAVAIDILL